MNDIRFEEREFTKVTVGKKDVIVLQYCGWVPKGLRRRIKKQAHKSFPGQQIVIIGGLKLGVVKLQDSCNLCNKMEDVCKECPSHGSEQIFEQ